MIDEKITQKEDALKSWSLSIWDALVASNGRAAYIPIIIVVFLMFCGASWQIFWSNTDAARYQCYALTFWLGGSATNLLPTSQCFFLPAASLARAPFHLLPLEYPPLTLLIFSLGLLVPLSYYQLLFALWMALTAVFIYWLLLRFGPRGAALTFALYALVGAWATAEGRFDMIPAALTLLCLIAALRKHWTAAYIALAFGVLLKIYPLLFLPVLFLAEQQDLGRIHMPVRPASLKNLAVEVWQTLRGMSKWRWWNTLLFISVLALITGLFALLDFRGAVVNQLSYFAQRPVQIESTASVILWAAHSIFPVHYEYTFGSLNVVSALSGSISLGWDAAFVIGYLYTIWAQWRGKLDVAQASIAVLMVFVATGKVFSPQYLIWLMPLLAYSCGPSIFWLVSWGSVSLLTTIIYPYLYTRTPAILAVPYVPGFLQAIAIRDTLFVFLTLAYLFDWFHIRSGKIAPTADTSALLDLAGLRRIARHRVE